MWFISFMRAPYSACGTKNNKKQIRRISLILWTFLLNGVLLTHIATHSHIVSHSLIQIRQYFYYKLVENIEHIDRCLQLIIFSVFTKFHSFKNLFLITMFYYVYYVYFFTMCFYVTMYHYVSLYYLLCGSM